jgi:hypothetical protein
MPYDLSYDEKTALIVVDVQNDFAEPKGSPVRPWGRGHHPVRQRADRPCPGRGGSRRVHPGLASRVDPALQEGWRGVAGALRDGHVGSRVPSRAGGCRSGGPQGVARRGRVLRVHDAGSRDGAGEANRTRRDPHRPRRAAGRAGRARAGRVCQGDRAGRGRTRLPPSTFRRLGRGPSTCGRATTSGPGRPSGEPAATCSEDSRFIPPAGRWAIERREDKPLVGVAILLPLPPGADDLEMGWHLHPAAWGHGYATEAGRALAAWAFSQGIDEVLAVVRPADRRAEAAVRRIGMKWVGETEKYYHLRLQVCRLRPADLQPDRRDPAVGSGP